MKEYAFASALLLNNSIWVYFLKIFICFSVAYELAIFKVPRYGMNNFRIRLYGKS